MRGDSVRCCWWADTASVGWIIAVALCALELIRGLPQPRKVARTARTDGVSSASTAVVAVLALAWLSYAVWTQAWAGVASGTIAAVLCVWCAGLVATHSGERARMAVVAGLGLGVAATAGVAGSVVGLGTGGLAVLLVGGTAAYGIPRLATGMTATSLAGLSPAYLGLNIADAAVFGIYGMLLGLPGYVGYAVVQAVTCGPVLVRWLLRPELR